MMRCRCATAARGMDCNCHTWDAAFARHVDPDYYTRPMEARGGSTLGNNTWPVGDRMSLQSRGGKGGNYIEDAL